MNHLGTDPRSPVRRDGAMQSPAADSSAGDVVEQTTTTTGNDAMSSPPVEPVDFLLPSSRDAFPISLHRPILSLDSSDAPSFFSSSLPYFLKTSSFSYKILFEFSSRLTNKRHHPDHPASTCVCTSFPSEPPFVFIFSVYCRWTVPDVDVDFPSARLCFLSSHHA